MLPKPNPYGNYGAAVAQAKAVLGFEEAWRKELCRLIDSAPPEAELSDLIRRAQMNTLCRPDNEERV